jgi:hypothetical protein
MATTYNQIAAEYVTGRLNETFGVSDNKGREFGCRVTLLEGENQHKTTDCAAAWFKPDPLMPAGRVYGYRPHAMRGGAAYGASQRAHWFATLDERDQAVVKYVKGARQRAMKNKAAVAA